MKTGGQYSLFRVLFGVYLAIVFLSGGQTILSDLGVLACIPFVLGFHDRGAAVVIGAILLIGPFDELTLIPAGFLLLMHLLLPPAPFGSWDARGRVDPRGGWSMPRWMLAATWVMIAIAYAYWAWSGKFPPGIVFLHLFALGPGLLPGARRGTLDHVFYDGSCGLCHRAVRFLIAEDASGTAFRYAPLGGDAFRAVAGDVMDLPDSMVAKTAAGALLVKSDAVLHLGRRLGGYWRLLATLGGLVPRALRDPAYDFVARIRYRLFARPKEACPMLPPDLRARFSA
jgi:predicted DCC family thiol-disulfide oxidoreductase YuxK